MTRQQPCRIPLGRGRCAIVDPEDYQRLAAFNWCAIKYGSRCYARRSVPPTSTSPRHWIRMHREILGFPTSQIDHVNGNGLDNRKANLRLATNSQNSANRRRPRTNTSGVKGVYVDKGRWRAIIEVLGRKHHLGYFIDVLDAARAYRHAARERFGEFARTKP